MKRIAITLIVATLALTGCSGSGGTPQGSTPAVPEAVVDLPIPATRVTDSVIKKYGEDESNKAFVTGALLMQKYRFSTALIDRTPTSLSKDDVADLRAVQSDFSLKRFDKYLDTMDTDPEALDSIKSLVAFGDEVKFTKDGKEVTGRINTDIKQPITDRRVGSPMFYVDNDTLRIEFDNGANIHVTEGGQKYVVNRQDRVTLYFNNETGGLRLGGYLTNDIGSTVVPEQ